MATTTLFGIKFATIVAFFECNTIITYEFTNEVMTKLTTIHQRWGQLNADYTKKNEV